MEVKKDARWWRGCGCCVWLLPAGRRCLGVLSGIVGIGEVMLMLVSGGRRYL